MTNPTQDREWAGRVVQGWNGRDHGRGTLESAGMSPNAVLRQRARSEAEFDTALDALDRVQRGDELTSEHYFALEAIIEPTNRPVIDIVADRYEDVPHAWPDLAQPNVRQAIERAIPAVGRVDVIGNPRIPFAGTAFFVGPRLMMTNRHVAECFANGLGLKNLAFRPGLTPSIDLKQEVLPSQQPMVLQIEQVVMIHPFWDCALLQVSGAYSPAPLRLMEREPASIAGTPIVVIGYPAYDSRQDMELQRRIFRVFDKKRLQPGLLIGYRRVISYHNEVEAVAHDASTLGGNSGSAVIDMQSGLVMALHFAGQSRIANFAVPTWELARDARIVDAGVSFARQPRPAETPWDPTWRGLVPEGASSGSEPRARTWWGAPL